MVPVEVETFFANLTPDNRAVRYHREVQTCRDGTDPADLVVADAAQRHPEMTRRSDSIIRSSSWHFDKDRRVLVISYLAFGYGVNIPDDDTLSTRVTIDDLCKRVVTKNALRPQDTDLDSPNIFRHAMSHLPMLLFGNPTVARALGRPRDRAHWQALLRIDPNATWLPGHRATESHRLFPQQHQKPGPPGIAAEIFYATIDTTGNVVFSRERRPVTIESGDPTDSVMNELMSLFPSVTKENTVLHSTSWRFDRARNDVVLTYIAYGHELPVATTFRTVHHIPVSALAAARLGGHDFFRTAPAGTSVLAHGLGHLAYLSRRTGATKNGTQVVLETNAAKLALMHQLESVPSGQVMRAAPRGIPVARAMVLNSTTPHRPSKSLALVA